MRHLSTVLAVLVLLAGCASAGARTTTASGPASAPAAAASQDTAAGIGPQYPSTYQRHPNLPVLIRNATIMTAAGQEIQGGSILFKTAASSRSGRASRRRVMRSWWTAPANG